MTPPCHSFPASELPQRVQLDVQGRRRKIPDSGTTSRKIDLSTCELLQMMQYKCEVQRPLSRDSPVQCFPVERLFRRCQDRKGSFMVETTAWEGKTGDEGPQDKGDGTMKGAKPYQWSSNWHDADTAP